jgi:hypothetical protein
VARVEIEHTVQSGAHPVSGASVFVYQRGTSTQVPVYDASSGGDIIAQPLRTQRGEIEGWVDAGSYDLAVSLGNNAYTKQWEAYRGDTSAEPRLSELEAATRPAYQFPDTLAAASADNNSIFRDSVGRIKRKDGSGNVIGRRYPQHIDLYGPQSQAAFALDGAIAASYAWPGSALSASTFEFYAGIDARVVYAVWQVVWNPTATGCGIQLIKFDPGPTNIEQIDELTGLGAGVRNDGELVTTAIQTIVDGIADNTIGSTHKQIGHQLKGDGAVGPKIYMSRVSIVWEVA